jgi:DNA segregation ATPase FtsK/SpoIIIE, S-DNA-T family
VSRLLAVIVGCNYVGAQRPDVPPLHAAEEDARDFSAFLTSTSFVDGELAAMQLLLGKEATTSNVRQAIERASAAQAPDDTLLFYFSGHGLRSSDGLTLYSWDSALPARALLDELDKNAGPVRIVLDCCHAAAIEPPTLSVST